MLVEERGVRAARSIGCRQAEIRPADEIRRALNDVVVNGAPVNSRRKLPPSCSTYARSFGGVLVQRKVFVVPVARPRELVATTA